MFLGGGRGNCLVLDETNILSILEDSYSINNNDLSVSEVTLIRKYDLAFRAPLQSDHDYCDIPNFSSALHGFSEFKKSAICYVAGYVGKLLSKSIFCFECNKALGSTKGTSPDNFINLKEFVPGSLFKPSNSLIRVCEETHVRFNRLLNSTHGKLPRGENICMVK